MTAPPPPAEGLRLQWGDLPEPVRRRHREAPGEPGGAGRLPARRVLPRRRRPPADGFWRADLPQGGGAGAQPLLPRLAPAGGAHRGRPAPRRPRAPPSSGPSDARAGWPWPSRRSTAGSRPSPGGRTNWSASWRPSTPSARVSPRLPSRPAWPAGRATGGPSSAGSGASCGTTATACARHLDPWSRRHLEALVRLERAAPAAVDGETLLHLDLRADNLLLTADRVLVVDWPHARLGAPWLDAVFFAPSVTMQGGPPPEDLLARVPAATSAEPEAITPPWPWWRASLPARPSSPAPRPAHPARLPAGPGGGGPGLAGPAHGFAAPRLTGAGLK